VERTTEAIGGEVGRAIEAKGVFGAARPWAWHKDAHTPNLRVVIQK